MGSPRVWTVALAGLAVAGCNGNVREAATSQGGSPAGASVSTGTGASTTTGACGGPTVTLATDQHGAYGVAVSATHLYWTTFDGLMSMPIAGGTPTAIASAQAWPFFLALDDTRVYWTEHDPEGSIMGVPIAGGSPSVIASGLGSGDGLAIAVDATNVYWTTEGPAVCTVERAPLAGGAITTIATEQALEATSVAVDATNVYWADYTDDKVKSAPVAGGPPVELASSPIGPFAITVDATFVYWTDGITVMKCALTGCGNDPTMVATAPGLQQGGIAIGGIAVDADNVYWTYQGPGSNGAVMKAPLAGGAPTMIACGQDMPISLALDATSVYWATLGDDTVMRAPK
jgi:hypothetical protein